MQRYKCTIAYDGTHFAGYQIQPGKRTVQRVLEETIARLHKGEPIRIVASGRTDSGVHARGQVIHFDSPLGIPESKWVVALNSMLPDDIAILSVEKAAADFHARFDAIGKEYRYFVHLSAQRDPFQRLYTYQYTYPANLGAMKDACRYLLGTHDFTSFCSAKTEMENRVRTLREVEIFEERGLLVFRFEGNGFLYNMVRILVGTLLEIGAGEREASSIPDLLEAKDRRLAGKTVPGQGLFLWKVDY